MNLDRQSIATLVQGLNSGDVPSNVQVVVAPPSVYLSLVAATIDRGKYRVSAQNVWKEAKGAFTGEVSAEMAKDVGCAYTILGHSERRDILLESDALIADKIVRALDGGLDVIACIGEHLEDRKSGQTEKAR